MSKLWTFGTAPRGTFTVFVVPAYSSDTLKTIKIETTFLSNAFWRVYRLRLFVLVWGISRMILTGKAKVLAERLVPVPLCPPNISHGLT